MNKDYKVVTTNGTFDVMHIGHIRLLQFAKSLGDKLIVGLNSDESVRAYKSLFRPINPQEYRKEFLEAIECVDEVVIFDEPNCRRFLREVKPDIHVKSKSGYKGLEEEVLQKYGGRLVLLNDTLGYSTTRMLERGTRAIYYERMGNNET